MDPPDPESAVELLKAMRGTGRNKPKVACRALDHLGPVAEYTATGNDDTRLIA